MIGKKILIVDDDKELVEELTVRFRAEGYEVISAYTGEDAIETAERELADLIVLDIMLPKMDGYTALKQIRERYRINNTPMPPVIVLTAKDITRDVFDIEGVDDYIVKPFYSHELAERVKTWLEA